jgi:hypothetical protein
MNDSIEDDWECQEIPPLIFHTSEQLRILEERRLIEEADNYITEDLFLADDKVSVNLTNNLTTKFIQKEKNTQSNNVNKAALEINQKIGKKLQEKSNRQLVNEEKQKEQSNILKKQKKIKND